MDLVMDLEVQWTDPEEELEDYHLHLAVVILELHSRDLVVDWLALEEVKQVEIATIKIPELEVEKWAQKEFRGLYFHQNQDNIKDKIPEEIHKQIKYSQAWVVLWGLLIELQNNSKEVPCRMLRN